MNKGFPSVDKFEWKSELTASPGPGTLSASLTKSASSTNAGVPGEITYKYPSKFGELTTKYQFANIFKLEYQKKDFPVKGFDMNGEFVAEPQKGSLSDGALKLGGDYRRDLFNGSIAINNRFGPTEDWSVKASIVIGNLKPGLAFGAEADVSRKTQTQSSSTVKTVASYSPTPAVVGNLFWKSMGNVQEVGANFYQKSSTKPFAVASEIVFKNDTSLKTLLQISLGSIYSPRDSTSIKSRLNSEGSLGVAVTEKLSSVTSVTGSVEVNLLNPSGANAFKSGLKISLSL